MSKVIVAGGGAAGMLFCCIGRKRCWGAALGLALAVVAGAAIFAGITMRKKKNLTESGEDTGAGQADGE